MLCELSKYWQFHNIVGGPYIYIFLEGGGGDRWPAGTNLAAKDSFPTLEHLCTSGLEAVPKKNGKWRVILHLSAPEAQSLPPLPPFHA